MLAAVAHRLVDGQVEAEEVDIGLELGLVEGCADLGERRVGLLLVGQVIELALLGGVDLPVRIGLPLGVLGVDHRGRVLLEQLAADREHDLVLRGARGLSRRVCAQRAAAGPAVQLRDIADALPLRVGRRPRGEQAADVPELPEVAAALVGRVLAPQELTSELVVEAGHVRLDEVAIGLEQRDAVLEHEVDIRHEKLGRDVRERLVHRRLDHRVGHDFLERAVELALYASRHLDRAERALWNGDLRLHRRYRGACQRRQVELDRCRALAGRAGGLCEGGPVAKRLLEAACLDAVLTVEGRREARGRLCQVEVGTLW